MGQNKLADPIRKSITNLIWRTPFALRQWPEHDVLLLFLLRSYTHVPSRRDRFNEYHFLQPETFVDFVLKLRSSLHIGFKAWFTLDVGCSNCRRGLGCCK